MALPISMRTKSNFFAPLYRVEVRLSASELAGGQSLSNGNTLTGTVVNIIDDRGFCFVGKISDGRKSSIFCHAKAFADREFESLKNGDIVEFVESTDRNGRLKAFNAGLCGSENQQEHAPRGAVEPE